jgi:hypothetical protein
MGEYAGATKWTRFKAARTSKADMGDWIEAQETLALALHPQIQLARKSTSNVEDCFGNAPTVPVIQNASTTSTSQQIDVHGTNSKNMDKAPALVPVHGQGTN